MLLRMFALLLAAVMCSQIQATDCEDVKELPAKDLVNFLNTSARTADPKCVEEAIGWLGDSKPRDKASIELLISLLDFRRPETEREKMHISTTRDWFPAVSALFVTGRPAVEPLIARLKSGKMTETARFALFFTSTVKILHKRYWYLRMPRKRRRCRLKLLLWNHVPETQQNFAPKQAGKTGARLLLTRDKV